MIGIDSMTLCFDNVKVSKTDHYQLIKKSSSKYFIVCPSPYISWDGLVATFQNGFLWKIEGSFAKFLLGQNFDGITQAKMPELTTKLVEYLGVDERCLMNARIQNIAFSVTAEVQDNPYKYITRLKDIQGRRIHSNKPGIDRINGQGYSFFYHNSNWTVCVYDKQAEANYIAPPSWEGKNAIRMEITLIKHRKIVQVFHNSNFIYQDLYEDNVWRVFSSLFEETLDKVVSI
jgi:hypothetical protein